MKKNLQNKTKQFISRASMLLLVLSLTISSTFAQNCTGWVSSYTQSTPTAIPTGPAVVTSTVLVSGSPTYLYKLSIETALTHTFAADLDITIMSPAGTIVTLTTDNGAGNDNVFNGTLWEDDANLSGQVPYTTNNGMVTDHAYVNLTTASPLAPEEPLGAFIGEDPNGTWTITISDDLAGDGGSLDSWTLNIVTLDDAPTISPATTFVNLTPTLIPTGPAVVTSTLTISGMGTQLFDLDVITNLAHTFAADLDITLMSPAGTIVTLTTDNGAGNDDVFNGTTWDDSANPGGQVPYTTNDGMATDHAYVNLTTATPLTPEEPLAAFKGEDPNGTWTITISDDLAGDGGALNQWSLVVKTATCCPVINPLITSNTGSFNFCKGSFLILDAGSYDGYLWSTGATTQTIATSSGATYTVTVSDANGCTGSASVTTVRVLAVPSKPGSITGPTTGLCNTSGNVFFISPVANTDFYQWTVTNGIIMSGQGTTSITVDYLGFSSSTISVRAQNACGNSSARTLTVSAKPATPLTIHGNKYGVCKLMGEKYSVDPVDGALIYRWSVPSGVMITSGQGTTGIEVNFGNSFSSGSICCRAENACGNSNWVCMNVHAKPQAPVIIIGPTSVCRNQAGVAYSTPSVYGATSYIWGVPSGAVIQSGQGTPSIIVNFGTHSGNVDVKAKNNCGSSSDYDLRIRMVCREDGDFSMGEVNVYPNPASSNMNVAITSDMNQKCIIRMIDLIGKQLMLDAVDLTEGNNLLQYDVSGYAKGLYFIVLQREGMPAETIRVIVE